MSIYMEGMCHVMAVALHRNQGSSFLVLCENAGDYHDSRTKQDVATVHHVFADFQNGLLVDIRGEHNHDDIQNQWEALNDAKDVYHVLELETEEELAMFVGQGWELPLAAYSDEDVDIAMKNFTKQHPNFDPTPPKSQM